MAIKRVDPSAKFRVISELDDALISETREELAASGATSRYEQYSESLDEKLLNFKDGAKPTYFIIRCLKNNEVAEIQAKHVVVTEDKRVAMSNPSLAFLDYFDKGCVGIESPEGKIEKVTSDDVGYGVAIGIGSIISLYTSLGKHLKK